MAGILRVGNIPDPDAVAADTLAQLEGATLWLTTSGDPEPLRRAAERAIDITVLSPIARPGRLNGSWKKR